MAALPKLKLKHGPLDEWSTKEQLALACSVMRSGDQNWVSVSRTVKPHGESNRPTDWFSQRNCALQYSDLLEKVSTPKRKRGEKGEVTETSTEQIVGKLTESRIEELKKIVVEQQQRYKKLKKDIEIIKSGQLDDKLPELWEAMVEKRKLMQQAVMDNRRRSSENKTDFQASNKQKKISEMQLGLPSANTVLYQDIDDSTQDSVNSGGIDVSALSDDSQTSTPTLLTPASTMTLTIPPPMIPTSESRTKSGPPTSPLLSSLLQSKLKSADSLQQLKLEAEEKHQQQILANQAAAATEEANQIAAIENELKSFSASIISSEALTPVPSTGAPTLSKLLFTPINTHAAITVSPQSVTGCGKPTITVDKPIMSATVSESTEKCDNNLAVQDTVKMKDEIWVDNCEHVDIEVKTEIVVTDGDSQTTSSTAPDDVGQVSQDESEAGTGFSNIEIKEEPPSPASSVSSKISESGGKSNRQLRRSMSSRSSKRSTRITRRNLEKDDGSSKHSEAEYTDDDLARESDDTGSILATFPSGVLWTDSVPNSPASMSMCSDTEDEKAFKIWKKSIMLVWRTAANHKYANVFTHPVTNEIAPGYLNVVHRPMNLSLIKRNIESGVVRTTSEFQRDMMLMFTNAIMYNSSDHNVYKMAVEMYDDVMENIEQFINTQIMVGANSDLKSLRTSRRSETLDKDEDPKKRRSSCDQTPEGGKTKKRKTRADDT